MVAEVLQQLEQLLLWEQVLFVKAILVNRRTVTIRETICHLGPRVVLDRIDGIIAGGRNSNGFLLPTSLMLESPNAPARLNPDGIAFKIEFFAPARKNSRPEAV